MIWLTTVRPDGRPEPSPVWFLWDGETFLIYSQNSSKVALNFDGEDSGPVREFFVSNAGYWIDEFHLDGLRLDATQNIYDDSANEHILAGISRVARQAAGKRSIILVAENEPQEARLAAPFDHAKVTRVVGITHVHVEAGGSLLVERAQRPVPARASASQGMPYAATTSRVCDVSTPR